MRDTGTSWCGYSDTQMVLSKYRQHWVQSMWQSSNGQWTHNFLFKMKWKVILDTPWNWWRGQSIHQQQSIIWIQKAQTWPIRDNYVIPQFLGKIYFLECQKYGKNELVVLQDIKSVIILKMNGRLMNINTTLHIKIQYFLSIKKLIRGVSRRNKSQYTIWGVIIPPNHNKGASFRSDFMNASI